MALECFYRHRMVVGGLRSSIICGNEATSLVLDCVGLTATFPKLRGIRRIHVTARIRPSTRQRKCTASWEHEAPGRLLLRKPMWLRHRELARGKITVIGMGALYPFPSAGLPLKEDMSFPGRPHPAQ
jgi:hypothetical protein